MFPQNITYPYAIRDYDFLEKNGFPSVTDTAQLIEQEIASRHEGKYSPKGVSIEQNESKFKDLVIYRTVTVTQQTL